MRKFLFYFSFFNTLCFFTFSQTKGKIILKGQVEGMNITDGTAFIAPLSFTWDANGYRFDSLTVSVRNNQFVFNGEMPYPHGFDGIYFRTNNRLYRTDIFFLDSGTIKIRCIIDSINPQKPIVIQSSTDEEFYDRFLPGFKLTQSYLENYLQKRSESRKKYGNNIPDTTAKLLESYRNLYINTKNKYLSEYIKTHPSSYIPLAFIGESLGRSINNVDSTEALFQQLPYQLKETISGQKIHQAFAVKRLSSLSDTLSKLQFYRQQYGDETLSPKSSKYTLVDFWFSTCAPCIRQFPDLEKLYLQYRNQGFSIVGINTDKTKKEWATSLKRYRFSYRQLWDRHNTALSRLLISSFPTNFLLDSNGKIIYRNIGVPELAQFLAKEFNKQ